MIEIFNKAVELGFFDPQWYQAQHRLHFSSDYEAFEDYVRKSPYTDVSPSLQFDTISYYENYPDVYETGMSPLVHYIMFGQFEGRRAFPLRPLWNARKEITAPDKRSRNGRYAIVLHIYYADFVERFYDALYGVDFNFDLFITTSNPEVPRLVHKRFSAYERVGEIFIHETGNHGRNFAPFLIAFGKQLLKYDYFCHLHSKKSLYSGKEQVQWASYLIEFLLKDKQVLSRGLDILEANQRFGMYYPTSFWNLPTWVNHWLKNKHQGREYLQREFGLAHHDEFIAYPVGGMFWARTSALRPLLSRNWKAEDFPPEPLPADGSFLHVLERALPLVAEAQGYSQFFYNPATGQFTDDTSYIYRPYLFGNSFRLGEVIQHREIISFDIFDTVVKRDLYEPDFAKSLIPERLGIQMSGKDFVVLRNEVELDLRRESGFVGDVDIYEVYAALAKRVDLRTDWRSAADLEFEIDLDFLNPKDVMLSVARTSASMGKKIYFVSDSYYTEEHIRTLLKKVGVDFPFELFVSSRVRRRKDNGTMWQMLSEKLKEIGKTGQFLHIGDNVCADCQIPGDFGLASFHILSPLDKWEALAFPSVRKEINMDNPSGVLKWGPLISQVGATPFI